MASSYTSRPSRIAVMRSRMWSASRKLWGIVIRSAEEWEMSRSFHSAMFSTAGTRLARITRRGRRSAPSPPGCVCGAWPRILLSPSERFLDLPDLGALEIAHFGGHLLEGAGEDRQGSGEFGVPVALDHLGGDPCRSEAERFADPTLDARRQMGEGADGSAQLAHPDRLAGGHETPAGSGPSPTTRAPASSRKSSARREPRGCGRPSGCAGVPPPAAAALSADRPPGPAGDRTSGRGGWRGPCPPHRSW